MDEAGFREYLMATPWYKRSAARARRLGRAYEGLDRTVDRVRDFLAYLAEHRGKVAEDADVADMRAFLDWPGKPAKVAPGVYRGDISSYLRFRGWTSRRTIRK